MKDKKRKKIKSELPKPFTDEMFEALYVATRKNIYPWQYIRSMTYCDNPDIMHKEYLIKFQEDKEAFAEFCSKGDVTKVNHEALIGLLLQKTKDAEIPYLWYYNEWLQKNYQKLIENPLGLMKTNPHDHIFKDSFAYSLFWNWHAKNIKKAVYYEAIYNLMYNDGYILAKVTKADFKNFVNREYFNEVKPGENSFQVSRLEKRDASTENKKKYSKLKGELKELLDLKKLP